MTKNRPLVLASTSTIRAEILNNAGIRFRAAAPLADEDAIKSQFAGDSPSQLALRLATAKALSLSAGSDLVIGADQVLALGTLQFGKPKTIADARLQLQQLRGKNHSLFSAVILARAGTVLWQCVDEARLVMRHFSDDFLEEYLSREGKSVLSSVGAYKLERRGIQLFQAVDGDHYTILGLPLLPLLEALRAHGAIDS
jgi:septum formation protein